MKGTKLTIPSSIDTKRLFTEKDLAGLFQVTRDMRQALAKLLDVDEESETEDFDDDVAYVALGRTPAVITEFMRAYYHIDIIDLPLGGMSGLGKKIPSLSKGVELLFKQCLPTKLVVRKKAIVVIDFAYGGSSIRAVRSLLQDYVEKCCLSSKPPPVLMVPITWKRDLLDDKLSLMHDYDPETRAAHRLLKVLFIEVDKPVYSRYGSIKYDTVASSSSSVTVSRFAQKAERESLEQAMALAMNLLKRSEIDLSKSIYLRKRKKLTDRYSYRFGYNPSDELRWKHNLLEKSAKAYSLPLSFGAQVRYTAKATQLDLKRRWWQTSMRNRRIVALAVLLLFVWAVYRLIVWALAR